MIKIVRWEPPPIIKEKSEIWQSNYKGAATVKERNRALQKYKHPKIREALEEIFHGKCAYCESKIGHISYTHIEHFRPKSKYEDLIFKWSNLFLSCPKCNTLKDDEFPLTTDGEPIINPCDDDPVAHFQFIFDNGIASVYGKTSRGSITEQLIQLNRTDLRAYRSQQIKRIAVIKIYAQSNPEAASIFAEAISEDAEFLAFTRIL